MKIPDYYMLCVVSQGEGGAILMKMSDETRENLETLDGMVWRGVLIILFCLGLAGAALRGWGLYSILGGVGAVGLALVARKAAVWGAKDLYKVYKARKVRKDEERIDEALEEARQDIHSYVNRDNDALSERNN